MSAIDKSTWGPGPWQDEPDRVEWEYAGFRCLVKRHPRFGNFCGYIALPAQHPWRTENSAPRCHGGITFNGGPLEENDVNYWVGFDAAHLDDFSPGSAARGGYTIREHETYRTLDYMKQGCVELAAQASMRVNGGIYNWYEAFAAAAAWKNPVSLTKLTWNEDLNVLNEAEFVYRGLVVNVINGISGVGFQRAEDPALSLIVFCEPTPIAYLMKGVQHIDAVIEGRGAG